MKNNETCLKIMERMMYGDTESPDVRAHMAECESCRQDLRMWQLVKNNRADMPEPPAHLDTFIKAAARTAASKKPRPAAHQILCWLAGTAAVFAVSFCVLQQNDTGPDTPAQNSGGIAELAVSATDWDMTDFNLELVMLESDLAADAENFDSEFAYTQSQLNMDYFNF